jgi:hypothetical protein
VSARTHGAHIDEEASFHGAAQEPVAAEVYALDRCIVEKKRNHQLRIVHKLAERRGPFRPRVARLLRVVGSAIPNLDLMAELEQPSRDVPIRSVPTIPIFMAIA